MLFRRTRKSVGGRNCGPILEIWKAWREWGECWGNPNYRPKKKGEGELKKKVIREETWGVISKFKPHTKQPCKDGFTVMLSEAQKEL